MIQNSFWLHLQLNNVYILDSVETLEHTAAAESSILIHPQEQAAKIRMENERKKLVSVCICTFLVLVMM